MRGSTPSSTHRELLVQLVGEQRVWEFSEVQLTERAHRMDVLNIRLFRQVGDMLRIKFMTNRDRRQDNYFSEDKKIYTIEQKGEAQNVPSTSELLFPSNYHIEQTNIWT